MQHVPSLMVTSRGMMGYGVSTGAAGGINIRGLAGGSSQMLVLIDGHPQYQGIYGHPISDSYQTLMAERVEVLRGPASVLYGSNAMGGVINIVTRNAAAARDTTATSLSLSAGSYGTAVVEATSQTRQGGFSSTMAANYSRTDNHRPRMGFEQYSGFLKLGYDISSNWISSLNADITHSAASYPGSTYRSMYSADQWITRGVVNACIENSYERTSGGLSIYSNFGQHRIDDGTADLTAPTQRYFRSNDALTGLNAYQSVQLLTGNRTTFGIDYQHIYGRAYYTSKLTGETLNTPNKQSGSSHRNEIAAYADFRQDITTWLTADAGLRLDYHSIAGTEWVPQLGVVVRPISTGEIKLMTSKGFRNPSMREMYLYPPSNDELKAERMWNYELSWRHTAGRLSYGANLYYIKGDNIILNTAVDGGRKFLNSGEIEHFGAEAEATYSISRNWSLQTNHSLLRMLHRDVAAAPKYKGYLGAHFASCQWDATAGVQYLSGVGLDNDSNGFADLQQKDICLLSASIGYSATRNIKLWLRGENLLAQRYELNYGYPMPRATVMGGIDIKF